MIGQEPKRASRWKHRGVPLLQSLPGTTRRQLRFESFTLEESFRARKGKRTRLFLEKMELRKGGRKRKQRHGRRLGSSGKAREPAGQGADIRRDAAVGGPGGGGGLRTREPQRRVRSSRHPAACPAARPSGHPSVADPGSRALR